MDALPPPPPPPLPRPPPGAGGALAAISLPSSADDHIYSTDEEITLSHIEDTFKEEFDGKEFPSKKILKEKLDQVGKSFGVYMSWTDGRIVRCSRWKTKKESIQHHSAMSRMLLDAVVLLHAELAMLLVHTTIQRLGSQLVLINSVPHKSYKRLKSLIHHAGGILVDVCHHTSSTIIKQRLAEGYWQNKAKKWMIY